MIYQDVELFNAEEVEEFDGGVMLQRFTKEACRDTQYRASWMVSAAMGCEIRFVAESDVFWITLGAVTKDINVYVMRGDYFYDKYTIKAGTKTVLEFENHNFLSEYKKIDEARFSHNVWRFYFEYEGPIVYYGIRSLHGNVRPPHTSEKPKKTILAYGSSITHGCWAMDSRNSYIQQAAQRLNMDVMNKGMAGACRLENSICDFLIDLKGWDIAFLELGVNVLDHYSVEKFEQCAEYLVKNLCDRNTDKPVFLTGSYYNHISLSENREKSDLFEAVLMNIGDKYNLTNLHYVSGEKIMDSTEYLSRDVVHPSDWGHIRMGENLARIIEKNI